MSRVLLSLLALQVSSWDYKADIETWRRQREERLRAPDGWLSLVGLSWLQPGVNTVGSDPGARVILPKPAPAEAGVLMLEGSQVSYRRDPKAPPRLLAADTPDFVSVGNFKLSIIRRGARYGVRVRDNASKYRRNFTGLNWYAPDPAWRFKAKFKPYPEPRTAFFDSLTGDKQEVKLPGTVEFEHRGKVFRLTPVLEGDQLFFVFRDKTAGKTTYAAARFLYADLPKGGFVEVDFNKAYNPPCAFTPYATCPLPPEENRLPISVEAGEKLY